MIDQSPATAADPQEPTTPVVRSAADYEQEIGDLRASYEVRLINAHLRTEAVRAGMLDLDGLKLADLSDIRLGPDDTLTGVDQVMEMLRRSKPWLFNVTKSSSSAAAAPPSQPARQKSALEMTDQEYAAARAALVSRKLF
jgi:hypothetical protein